MYTPFIYSEKDSQKITSMLIICLLSMSSLLLVVMEAHASPPPWNLAYSKGNISLLRVGRERRLPECGDDCVTNTFCYSTDCPKCVGGSCYDARGDGGNTANGSVAKI